MIDSTRSGRPEKWGLIIQGLQNDGVGLDGKMFDPQLDRQLKERAVIENVASLAKAVRAASGVVIHALLVVERGSARMLTNTPNFRKFITRDAVHRGSWGAQPDARVLDNTDYIVEKLRVNPFYGSILEPLLTAAEVTHIISTGTQTNMGVEHAVRHGSDMGYEIFVADDACAAADVDAHHASLRYTMPKLATIMPTADLVARIGSGGAAPPASGD